MVNLLETKGIMMEAMELATTEHNVRLTASEVAFLWSGYMGDSMAWRILSYFLRCVEDQEIKLLLQKAAALSEDHLNILTNLFQSEDHPVPQGFGDKDVKLQAKRLFSDTLFLHFLKNVAKEGLALYSMSLAGSARKDIREYFTKCIISTTELYNEVSRVLLEKGLYIRSPLLPTPEAVEFVHKESFINGLLGEERVLNAMEISHLYTNIQTNALGKALITGFAQCCQSEELRDYFLRGKDIAHKQIEVFSSILRDEDLPAPMTWDSDIMDSTEAPFSDKLMLYHITGINAAGASNYGAALAYSMRRDLTVQYSRLLAEIGTYADVGVELMIKNGWMEKLPGAVNRKKLATLR